MNILAQVKQFLKIVDNSKDDVLTQFITDSVDLLETICGQPIELVSMNLPLNIQGEPWICHYTVPVVVTSITYKIPFYATDYPLVEGTDWIQWKENSMVHIEFTNKPRKQDIYKVVAQVGFGTNDIPKIIRAVAVEMVVTRYKESVVGENLLNKTMSNQQMGGGIVSNVTYDTKLIEKWTDRLRKYALLAI